MHIDPQGKILDPKPYRWRTISVFCGKTFFEIIICVFPFSLLWVQTHILALCNSFLQGFLQSQKLSPRLLSPCPSKDFFCLTKSTREENVHFQGLDHEEICSDQADWNTDTSSQFLGTTETSPGRGDTVSHSFSSYLLSTYYAQTACQSWQEQSAGAPVRKGPPRTGWFNDRNVLPPRSGG